MISTVLSLGILGIDSYLVTCEADLSRGLPSFDLVGLPDATVKEARDRVRVAAKNSGFPFPASKIIVNLAPANTKKAGSVYDLPILISILQSAGSIACELHNIAIIGELSLSGDIRPVTGALPMVLGAMNLGLSEAIIPWENSAEGAVVAGISVFAAKNVHEVVQHLMGKKRLPLCRDVWAPKANSPMLLDFADVKGQENAKRALTVAAAGGHNILMIGSPGSGKSMLAKRIPSILPPMTMDEEIETTKIHSVAGFLQKDQGLVTQRPFRSPHHSVSVAGLTGGGSNPKPGEVSLAHNGVLFLDELPEFQRAAMEGLRQPIEDGSVTISRASGRITYPGNFMLVAAMNPCPCGYFGHPTKKCICSQNSIKHYISHISGPLLDRIDLHIEVPPVDYEHLADKKAVESSEIIRKRVEAARIIQDKRFSGMNIYSNSDIPRSHLEEFCSTTPAAQSILKLSFEKLGLSARGYDRILKVARTIADLDESPIIDAVHISEAVQYRSLDRKYWDR